MLISNSVAGTAALSFLGIILISQFAIATPNQLPGQVHAIHIVSHVGPRAAEPTLADRRPKRARADRGVTLYAVLEVARGQRREYYSDADTIRIGARTIRPRPIADAPPVSLRWYKVEPDTEVLSNTRSGRFQLEEIPYVETPVPAWDDRATVRADVRPTVTADRGRGVGTMRYKLEARSATATLTTAGREATRERGGGLRDDVHQVSLRRDDSYLGMLTELFGQPYIWASGGQPARQHQSERLEGADCADFIVYGWRRLGHRVDYTWSQGLREYTRLLAAGEPGPEHIFRDRHGQPVPFPEPGDLLLFPRHVGALVEDRGVPGVLDGDDIMMHTLFQSPREQSIADAGYAGRSLEVRRWRRARR